MAISATLSDDSFDDFGRVDAGEFLVQTHEGEGEFVVVDADLVQNGGVEVADPDFVFIDVVAIIVGFSVGHATFDAAASHPSGEAFRMVVAAVLVAL